MTSAAATPSGAKAHDRRHTRAWFVAINLMLGPLVPLSYLWSARRWPEHVGALWGQLPDVWRIPYTANMFFAAAGYLLFTWYVFRHGQRELRLKLRHMNAAYLAILIPSMAWMPLTLHALASGNDIAWLIQLVLATTAAGSIAVLVATMRARSHRPMVTWARVGAAFFCVQTVLLDAIIWPRFFHIAPTG